MDTTPAVTPPQRSIMGCEQKSPEDLKALRVNGTAVRLPVSAAIVPAAIMPRMAVITAVTAIVAVVTMIAVAVMSVARSNVNHR